MPLQPPYVCAITASLMLFVAFIEGVDILPMKSFKTMLVAALGLILVFACASCTLECNSAQTRTGSTRSCLVQLGGRYSKTPDVVAINNEASFHDVSGDVGKAIAAAKAVELAKFGLGRIPIH